jgi:cellulose synthase/poly-beta-1,6-N-acetylglucosamine synthase-like glycosyltransferase
MKPANRSRLKSRAPAITITASDSVRVYVPVSVIVPCHNEEESIPHLVQSLEALQMELPDEYKVQLILVDDGSSDNTWPLLNRYFGSRALSPPDSNTLTKSHAPSIAIAATTRANSSPCSAFWSMVWTWS